VRQRGRETEEPVKIKKKRDRDRQRQTETDRDRQRQTETDREIMIYAFLSDFAYQSGFWGTRGHTCLIEVVRVAGGINTHKMIIKPLSAISRPTGLVHE
jgi:hypothetical protein